MFKTGDILIVNADFQPQNGSTSQFAMEVKDLRPQVLAQSETATNFYTILGDNLRPQPLYRISMI